MVLYYIWVMCNFNHQQLGFKDAADLEPPQCSTAGIGAGTRAAGGSGAAMGGRGGVGFIFEHRVDDRRNGAAHAAGFYVCCFKGLFGGFMGFLSRPTTPYTPTPESGARLQTPATTRLQLRVFRSGSGLKQFTL